MMGVAADRMRSRKSTGGGRGRGKVLKASVLVGAALAAFTLPKDVHEETSSLLNLAGPDFLFSVVSNAPQRMISKNVLPVSCAQVLEQFRSGNATDPNGGKLFARYTVTKPPFWVSFHNSDYDPVRFSTFHYGKYYETKLSGAFADILSAPGKHRVIDVGGNIGWFSLLSASLGAEVSTFEPNAKNYLRTCESMRLNGWLPCNDIDGGCLNPGEPSPEEFNSRIHIYPYGVAEKEGRLFFKTNENNPGGSEVTKAWTNESLRVVSLDGMAKELGWYDTDISILKVDVEGQELGVFAGSEQMLRSKRIQNILMEGSGRLQPEVERLKKIAKILIEVGYVVYKMGGYRGPTNEISAAEGNLAENIVNMCVGGKKRTKAQCNLWWKAKPQQGTGTISSSSE